MGRTRLSRSKIASVGLFAGAGAAWLGVVPVAAGAVSARAVTAVTHSSDHPDTTSVSGPCTKASAGGPVWAYDNLSFRLRAVPEASPGSYSVTITANGSFDAFADPTTGACATDRGAIDGWLEFDVSSTTPPDPANVPAQVSGELSQGELLQRFFDGHASIVGGGHYRYTYNRIDGQKYIQVG